MREIFQVLTDTINVVTFQRRATRGLDRSCKIMQSGTEPKRKRLPKILRGWFA